MSFVDVVRYRLRVLLRPDAFARDRVEEIRHHLELEAASAQSVAGGTLSGDEAQARARRRFGNVTYSTEERHMISGLALIDAVRQDVQFVVRLLRRRAGFAVVTLATIALGIGAATSIYSVADAVLFRPLAFPHADRLVTVWLTRPKWKAIAVFGRQWDRGAIPLPLFRDWRAVQKSFDDVAVWNSESAIAGDPSAPEEVVVAHASASLLSVLGVHPERGAWFTSTDDVVHGAPVVVVSHETWVGRFGRDPRILGQRVYIDGIEYTVVGIAPPGLSLDRSGTRIAYWLPASQDVKAANDRSSYGYQAIGRLKPSVSLDMAAIESGRFFRSALDDDRVSGVSLTTLRADQTRAVRRPLLMLLGASGLLLLIACINVATLLMGEAVTREGELRTRTALGATRGRLIRQLLTESVVLASAGAAVGAALAFGGTKLIVRAAPASIPGLADVRVDTRILAVVLVVAIAVGVLFGLTPAFSSVRSSQSFALGGGGHATHRRTRGQRWLVACEVALSMVLLVAAGLLVRSFGKLSSVGFRPEGLLVVSLRLPQSPYADSTHARAIYDDILTRVRGMPGVAGAAATTTPPFTNGSSSSSFEVEGRAQRPGEPARDAQRRVTTPDFFATLGIPILAGRSYSDADGASSPLVVVVSRALARQEWPGESAVGKRIKFGGHWRTVVGVADDIHTERPLTEPLETVYAPLAQLMLRGAPALVVRTHASTTAETAELRRAVRAVEADISVSRVDDMNDLVSTSLADDRLRMVLISLFATIAALLAAVGAYGVAATAARRRTREMAIRVAVGASSGSIARLIVGGAAKGVAAGAVVGVGLALVGARALSPYLYGVSIGDPIVYAGVAVLLALTTVVATWVPARRATRVRLTDTLAEP
jgi:predicted permease